MKKKEMTYAEKTTQKLRIAAYPDAELLERLDKWCAENNKDRNSAIRHIMQTMLGVNDDTAEVALNQYVVTAKNLTNELESRLRQAETAF